MLPIHPYLAPTQTEALPLEIGLIQHILQTHPGHEDAIRILNEALEVGDSHQMWLIHEAFSILPDEVQAQVLCGLADNQYTNDALDIFDEFLHGLMDGQSLPVVW